jgi:hypothetical protein
MTVQQLTLSQRTTSTPANTGLESVAKDIKVVALMKGKEQYVFLYNEGNRAETLRLLGRYASNPELSFTWYDAAVLSQKIRQESLQQTREKQRSESAPRHSVSLPMDELF